MVAVAALVMVCGLGLLIVLRTGGARALLPLRRREAFAGASAVSPKRSPVGGGGPLGQAKGIDFVAVLDIERLSQVRQKAGADVADELLSRMIDRLVPLLPNLQIGRQGRTTVEFGFAASAADRATALLNAAADALEEPLVVDGISFSPSVAIGFVERKGVVVDEPLLDRAAAGVELAWRERVKVRLASGQRAATNGWSDAELMHGFSTALRSGYLSVVYQPKLHARENRVASAEALVRWTDPVRGLIPTERFVAVLEETGTIRDLTEWVLDRVVHDQRALLGNGLALDLYVNISGQLLTDERFVTEALERAGGAIGRIGFEVTETAVIGDPQTALANLHRFTEAGIAIAIDDYGSGLSSLAYLKQLPAQELKIDRMFISALTSSHRDPLLVRSSIDLAHALEMEVTAEGVDDPVSLALLRVMGCDLLQGYLIAPPLPLGELTAFLLDPAALDHVTGPTSIGPAALRGGPSSHQA